MLSIPELLTRLATAYGNPQWWPAQSAFEVIVGAVLTQNTQWSNVEKAIGHLRSAQALTPASMAALPEKRLAELIRPSGYYRVKARRLRAVLAFLDAQGGIEALARDDTHTLRAKWLGVHGVGPETADDIVLYAFSRPVFVVDAYTRRLFGRLGLTDPKQSYDALRLPVETALQQEVAALNHLHALIVIHAKQHCRVKPRCSGCPLASECTHGEHGEKQRIGIKK